ncbi:MAG: cation transporter [Chloroflexi bacterium]|nr:cation transporter [Chloroflexota bacterium]
MKDVVIDFSTAIVRYERGKVTPEQLLSALKGAGFGGTVVEEVTLKVEGMGCEGCYERVEEALSKVPGVRSISTDPDSDAGEITVEFEKGAVGAGELIRTIEGIGSAGKAFKASVMRSPFRPCLNC